MIPHTLVRDAWNAGDLAAFHGWNERAPA